MIGTRWYPRSASLWRNPARPDRADDDTGAGEGKESREAASGAAGSGLDVVDYSVRVASTLIRLNILPCGPGMKTSIAIRSSSPKR